MEQSQTDSTLRLLRNLRGFAFDLDGTIWEGPTLLPGAVELISDPRTAGTTSCVRVQLLSIWLSCSRSSAIGVRHYG